MHDGRAAGFGKALYRLWRASVTGGSTRVALPLSVAFSGLVAPVLLALVADASRTLYGLLLYNPLACSCTLPLLRTPENLYDLELSLGLVVKRLHRVATPRLNSLASRYSGMLVIV